MPAALVRSAGVTDTDGIRALIAAVRARSNRPINVNVFCHRLARPDPQRESAWIERFATEFKELDATPTARRLRDRPSRSRRRYARKGNFSGRSVVSPIATAIRRMTSNPPNATALSSKMRRTIEGA